MFAFFSAVNLFVNLLCGTRKTLIKGPLSTLTQSYLLVIFGCRCANSDPSRELCTVISTFEILDRSGWTSEPNNYRQKSFTSEVVVQTSDTETVTVNRSLYLNQRMISINEFELELESTLL